MTYNVSGYMTLHYHFYDVEVEADSEEDITEWDVINASMDGWDGEMMDYKFDEDVQIEVVDDEVSCR